MAGPIGSKPRPLYKYHVLLSITVLHTSYPAYEDGTDRVLRNVGIQQSDARETPKRIHTRFKTRRKFEIKNYLYLSTALHVSGGNSTHHQELISLYLQYLALMRPLLLSAVNVTGWKLHPFTFTLDGNSIQSRSRQISVTVPLMPATVDTVI